MDAAKQKCLFSKNEVTPEALSLLPEHLSARQWSSVPQRNDSPLPSECGGGEQRVLTRGTRTNGHCQTGDLHVQTMQLVVHKQAIMEIRTICISPCVSIGYFSVAALLLASRLVVLMHLDQLSRGHYLQVN